MRYSVAQLLKSPLGATREYELNEDINGIDPDLDIVAPLVGKVEFLRTGSGILVTGRLHTEAIVTCSRCLHAARVPVNIALEEEFRPSIDLLTGATLQVEDGDDPATQTDAHHILDLTEVVRQGLLLAVPMSPVCNPQCRGLCPSCGTDLNECPCECQPEVSDPRLASLRELL